MKKLPCPICGKPQDCGKDFYNCVDYRTYIAQRATKDDLGISIE